MRREEVDEEEKGVASLEGERCPKEGGDGESWMGKDEGRRLEARGGGDSICKTGGGGGSSREVDA